MNLGLTSLRRSKAGEFLIRCASLILKYVGAPSGSKAYEPRERLRSRDLPAYGFTLVEMTVVIAVILVLVGAASLSVKPYFAYRDGRAAGEMLRAVKAAQLMYLSDNPS